MTAISSRSVCLCEEYIANTLHCLVCERRANSGAQRNLCPKQDHVSMEASTSRRSWTRLLPSSARWVLSARWVSSGPSSARRRVRGGRALPARRTPKPEQTRSRREPRIAWPAERAPVLSFYDSIVLWKPEHMGAKWEFQWEKNLKFILEFYTRRLWCNIFFTTDISLWTWLPKWVILFLKKYWNCNEQILSICG